MPVGHRGVGFARRHTTQPSGPVNNATDLWIWGGTPVGDPYNSNGAIPVEVGSAKLEEWNSQRMIQGGGWIASGVSLNTVRGTSATAPYTADGSLPLTPEIQVRSWYQQAAKPSWSGGASWPTRTAALGMGGGIAMYAGHHFGTTQAFNTTWHDNSLWGASTVAGALSAPSGTILNDFVGYCKTAKAAGKTEIYFDIEQGFEGFRVNYAGKPGADNEQTTRNWVMLRAQQLALVCGTYLDVPGGPAMGAYYLRHTASLNELNFYINQNGAVPANVFNVYTVDSFLAGLACETLVRAVYLVDQTYYRLDSSHIPGTAASDNWATAFYNCVAFDQGNRFARLSQLLAANTSLTAAQRLAAMRKTNHCLFIWPSEGVGAGGEGGPMTPANYQVMTRAAVKYSMGGRHYMYVQSLDDRVAAPDRDHGDYEAGWAAELVPANADNTPPVCTITTPTSSGTYSTALSTVTIGGTATDDIAIHRVEWSNAANFTSGTCTLTWVNDSGANWNPLNASLLPRNSSLGRVQWHMTWTADIPLAATSNHIVFIAYDTHGNQSATAVIDVTSAPYSFDFTGTDGAAVAGWTQFAGTVTTQSNKMRHQAPASALGTAGAHLTSTLPFQDYELTANATLDIVVAGDFYGATNLRATGTAFTNMMHNNGWHLRWVGASGAAELYRIDGAGAQTFLTSGAGAGFVLGSVLRMRVRIIGQNIKIRYWKNAELEPGTWQIDYTDTSAPTGNRVSLACRNGAGITANRWGWDDVVITQIAASAPVADFTVSANPAPNVATTFTDISTNTPTQWLWNFGDGGTSTLQNPTHTYTAIGTYQVQLTATNAAGSNAVTKSVGVAAGSSNPSGQAPPSGNVAGWNLSWVEDFNTNSAEGTWGPTEHVVPAAYAAHFAVYEDGWFDTSSSIGENASSRYMPTQVLSTSNSCLQWRLFNSGGGARSAAVEVGGDIDSARISMRFRAESVDGFKTAWLFWPQSGNWPPDGEIDFPEGSLQGGTIQGYMHRQGATSGSDQDSGDSGQNYQSWHTAVVEWEDGVRCKFILDGVTILDVTSRVPNTPMHFVLQTESDLGSNQPPNGTSGLMFLDWIAYFTKA